MPIDRRKLILRLRKFGFTGPLSGGRHQFMIKGHSKKRDASFDISIWKRALIENRHARERQRLQTVDKVLNAIEHLSNTYQWDDLYIFGSAAKRERFDKVSDIDIGIEGLDKFLHYRFVADLSRLIEREVDVVRLEDCNFTDAIKTRGIRWKKEK